VAQHTIIERGEINETKKPKNIYLKCTKTLKIVN
jgi:hypothetical protein